MNGYKGLIAWRKAMMLAKQAYVLAKQFPGEERFALAQQVRRSAVSVPSNIAEGQGRFTRGEFKQFLGYARGSLYELETQIHLAVELGYLDKTSGIEFMRAAREVGMLLNGLLASLKSQLTTDN